MVYVVGVPDPHVAIGTSATAVAANAAVNSSNHASAAAPCSRVLRADLAAAGTTGAFTGSIFGKMLDGYKLLALFALLMLVIAMLMLATRSRVGLPDVQMNWTNSAARHRQGLRSCHWHAVRLLRHRRRIPASCRR